MAVSCEIFVILGPTASGKSELAMSLARSMSAEILSVDSMQLYRGMNIGTAKPVAAEQSEIRHHLIDLVEPDQPFTVARYVEGADAAIADAARRGSRLIATGGTPMFYKALFEGLFEGPGADPAIRERLRALSGAELFERVKKIDPAAADRMHPNDTKRLIRALEVFELTGKPISDLQNEWGVGRNRHPARWFGLEWERDALNRRINARVRAMIAGGWVEETRALLERYGALSPTAAEATGYRELIDCIRNRAPLDDAVEQIKIATRQLARRQMKWFRRFPGVKWVRGDQPLAELTRAAREWWEMGNCSEPAGTDLVRRTPPTSD